MRSEAPNWNTPSTRRREGKAAVAKKAKKKRPDEQVGVDLVTIRLALVIAVVLRLLTGH
jgi:hypothetical protein